MKPEQPTLFEPPARSQAKKNFLAGMVARWRYGDHAPTKEERAECDRIASDILQMVHR